MSSLSVTTLRAWEVTGLLVIPALCLSSLLVGRKGTGTLQQCWGSCSAWCSAHLHEDGNALLIYFVPVLPTFSFKKKRKKKPEGSQSNPKFNYCQTLQPSELAAPGLLSLLSAIWDSCGR